MNSISSDMQSKRDNNSSNKQKDFRLTYSNIQGNSILGEEEMMYGGDEMNESEIKIDTAVKRLFDDASRRKELKERIQLLSAKRELEDLRQQPEINKKSSKLLNKDTYVPIHERYEKVIHDMVAKKIEASAGIMEESIQKDPDAFFPTFQPKTNNREQFRDLNQFFEDSDKWNQDKQYKQKLKQLEKFQQQ